MLNDRRGVAALELGLIAPCLLVLMLAGYDLTLWIRSAFRLNEAAASMGQTISQCTAINDPADIAVFDSTAQLIAGSTDITSANGGAFIISAVGYSASNQLVVLWQRRMGNPTDASRVGASGGAASLGGYRLPAGQLLIATETFSAAQPWSLSRRIMPRAALPPLYSSALFVARSSYPAALATLVSSASTPACAS